MLRTNFRQRDLERIFRAAKAIGAAVQIDLRSLVVTVIPSDDEKAEASRWAPFGKENWDD